MAQQLIERAGRDKHNYARTGRMALYGGGQLHPPSAIRTIPTDFSRAQNTYLTLFTTSHSRFRPRGYNLVQIPPTKNHLPKPKSHNRHPRPCRPVCFCDHQHVRLLEQYGDHGGFEPHREIKEHIWHRPGKKLDGLARGAVSEFQVCAVGT